VALLGETPKRRPIFRALFRPVHLALAVAALLAGLGLAAGGGGVGSASGAAESEGLIAFARALDGAGDIFVVSADGRVQRGLTARSGYNFPQWSPDGTKLVAVYGGSVESAEISLVDVGGGAPRLLTRRAGFDGFPAWSPDGRRIAWAADRSGNLDVWEMDADGGQPHRLTSGGTGTRPQWSPDGRRLAFLDPGHEALAVVAADGGRLRPLAGSVSPGPSAPAWSPDGRRIAFIGLDQRLRVVRSDGRGRPRSLVRSGAASPAWSPDGRTIAFIDARDGSLRAVSAAGGPARRLARRTDGMGAPSWSPDGRLIAFSDGTDHIALVGADGRGLRRLTHGPEADSNPVWQPARGG